jgi:hypothetical protein
MAVDRRRPAFTSARSFIFVDSHAGSNDAHCPLFLTPAVHSTTATYSMSSFSAASQSAPA